MSLVDMLQQTIAKQIAQNAAAKTGLPPALVEKLMPMAQSMMMSKIAKNAQNPAGAEALASALTKHDGGILANIGSLAGDNVMQDGARMLGHVFGGSAGQSQAESALAKMGGIDAKQAGGLLAMAGPLVMGALGQKSKAEGLTPGTLAGILKNEGATVRRAAPKEMGGIFDLIDSDDDGDFKDDLAGIGKKMLGGLFGKR